MIALTIHQPWAWAIVRGIKKLENRDWRPSRRDEPWPLLIHAGQTWNPDDFNELAKLMDRAGVPEDVEIPEEELPTGGIVGVVDVVGVVEESVDPFFIGKYGIVMTNPRPVQFIPCSGKLGLWRPKPRVIAAVRRALKKRPPASRRSRTSSNS